MTEKEIIKGCCNKDRRCQNALYKLYYPLMSSIAIRYFSNKDDAMYGLNYGFLKVLQNIENYSSEYTLATWIRTILVNHFIDEFRKNNKFDTILSLDNHSLQYASAQYNEAEFELNANDLRELLNGLPNVTSKVFNLFAIDGFKHKEIAKKLNISINTSKWHVREARKILQEKIAQQNERESKYLNNKTAIG